MSKPYDTHMIAVVGQRPFEVELNQFCKLIPLMYVDGIRPSPDSFPNDGEVWWMLTSQTASLAEPGRLVVCGLENAVRFDEDDVTASQYQAQRESVHDLRLQEGLEVIDIPGGALDAIQDVVAGGFRMRLPHRCTPYTMLRWRSNIYGPFASSIVGSEGTPTGDQREMSFSPASADMTVFQIADADFRMAAGEFDVVMPTSISMTSQRRSENIHPSEVTHELLLAQGYERILARNPDKLVMEPIDRKLMRFAKQYLVRSKRQQLGQLLKELEVTGRETQDAEQLIEAVQRIALVTEKQDAALDEVAKALLTSGVLGEDRIKKAELHYAEKYVEERTAALQAQVEENVKARRDELRAEEGRLKGVQARLLKEESQRRSNLQKELEAERQKAKSEIATEREDFERQKTELERQQELLRKNLGKVTKDLREAGDEVVNRFLTIAPLLGAVGMTGRQTMNANGPTSEAPNTKAPPATFEIPAVVIRTTGATASAMAEDAFFERFSQVVESSGFAYRQLDLKRFHVSVKCGDVTALGGPSGTGKSSLPALYSRALLGDEIESGRPGCLMVNINPSWMDVRDLIGHMNTLDGRFYPAESGLFQHLVYAQEEYKARGEATGMYLTCLDEMNLSQIEHYFSDFMMILEREGGHRTLRCFSSENSATSCPFRSWASVTVSPAIRFIGTVNFDETTRLLSDRFLDRVNLLNLASGPLPAVGGNPVTKMARASGRMVTLADFNKWQGDGALPGEMALVLDSIRPVLSKIGCPMSPRVYRAICRFVSSSAPLLPTGKAFDLQLAQRVVPKVRSLVTKRQLDALDDLLRLLKANTTCSFDETVPLLEDVRQSSAAREWGMEE